MRALDRLLTTQPPLVLYHYTSFAAFKNIIETRKLWATNIRYLNDAEELNHALRLALDYVKLKQVHSEIGTVAQQCLEGMLSDPEFPAEGLSVCVASFSQKGDVLSQWRGYCPNSLGISIGFDPGLITGIIANHGDTTETFSKCLYLEREKKELVEELFANVCNSVTTLTGKNHNQWEDQFRTAMNELFKVAPLLKHDSFQEEQEWRYIYPCMLFRHDKMPFPSWKFRTNSSTMIPYVELNLQDGHPLHLPEVILSPTPHSQRAVEAVEIFLAANDVTCDHVRVSAIPFRSW